MCWFFGGFCCKARVSSSSLTEISRMGSGLLLSAQYWEQASERVSCLCEERKLKCHAFASSWCFRSARSFLSSRRVSSEEPY